PEEELVETPFYQIFMKPLNWRHAVSLLFWESVSPPVLDCVLSVYRTATQCAFSCEEIARLPSLHPEIERARLRIAGLEDQRAALRSLQSFLCNLPVPVVLLSWQFKVLYQNREAREYFNCWQGGSRMGLLKPTGKLPTELLSACKEMKEAWGNQL